MDLFSRKKQNTEDADEMEIREPELFIRPKREKYPARIFSLLFVLLFSAAVIALLLSDRERAVETAEVPVETAAPVETLATPEVELVIPDYNQQPEQAQIDYPKVEKNSVVYEIRKQRRLCGRQHRRDKKHEIPHH